MPYRHGFSEESIHHNIALFIREGYPQDQAVAMALDIARKAWRREHPRGNYPAHLKGMRGPRKRRRGKRARRNRASSSATLQLGPGREMPENTAILRRSTLKARYAAGDLNGAVKSAGHYARKHRRTMYVYEGNSYMHRAFRVSDKPSEYLSPINNTGDRVVSVTPDLIVSIHEVYR